MTSQLVYWDGLEHTDDTDWVMREVIGTRQWYISGRLGGSFDLSHKDAWWEKGREDGVRT